MTVLDILKTASIYLNLDGTLDPVFAERDYQTWDNENGIWTGHDSYSVEAYFEEEGIFAKLLTSFNEMVGYICANHFDIIDRRDITFDADGCYDLSLLPYRLKKVISIISGGKVLKYQYLGNIVSSLPLATATIVYSFLPEELTEHDDFDFASKVDIGTLALGVAWFYSLNCAIYDDAELFKEQFLTNIGNISPVRNAHIRQRRWE